MRFRSIIFALAFSPSIPAGQHGDAAPSVAPPPAEAKQFDFLAGQWKLTVTPRVSSLGALIHGVPKLAGTWTGWRALDGWGIEDDLRITDASGNPKSLLHSVRLYDAKAHRWALSNIDVYRATFISSTAALIGGAMTVSSHGTDTEGKTYLSRGRYTSITPAAFHFTQERSYDDGRTWETYLTVRAKRVPTAVPR
jgi:hypothetical protein